MRIRLAKPQDAEKLLEIYAPCVRDTAISFECTVPTVDAFRERIAATLREYPYLVAEEDGQIGGYCYASSFHNREAYKHTAETSIYISEAYRRRGVGTALYAELERRLYKQNVFTLYACVTYTERDDVRLPKTSVLFHASMGYTEIGRHRDCGYKFGKWYGILWLEKHIAERPLQPEAFIPFSALAAENCE